MNKRILTKILPSSFSKIGGLINFLIFFTLIPKDNRFHNFLNFNKNFDVNPEDTRFHHFFKFNEIFYIIPENRTKW
jgi:hypothetical protein